MPTIVFFMDGEAGHFLPAFRLAKDLRARGHRVVFAGLASAGPLVREQGFDLVPIFADLPVTADLDGRGFGLVISGQAFDGLMSGLKPDVIVALSLYYPEALAIHLRYQVPIVLMATFCPPSDTERAEMIEGLIANRLMNLQASALRTTLDLLAAAGLSYRSFGDLAAIVVRMPELVLLPRAIELPELRDRPGIHYIGSGVDLERREAEFSWDRIAPDRPLIFGSLGSQADLKPELSRRFIRACAGVADARPDLQFLLSVGRAVDSADLERLPPNVQSGRWLPQLEILRHADLMVTHGGPGTVKECILLGVPMVTMPLMRDQFEMSRRIVHHWLGVQGNLPEVSPETLGVLIEEALGDSTLRARVAAMGTRFEEEDRSGVGVRVIEAAVAA